MAGVIDGNEGIVVAYFAFAALCLLASSMRRPARGKWDRTWLGAGWLVLALGVARELEVGSLIMHIGRELAWSNGLYESRRPFQAALVGATLGIGVVILGLSLYWLKRRRALRYVPVVAIVVALVVFALIRTLSLHYVDQVLYNRHIAGIRVGSVIEMLLLMAGSALAAAAVVRAREPGTAGDAAGARGSVHTNT